MQTTTLKQIESKDPCKDGYRKLLKSLVKTKADNEDITLEYILKSNGLSDACWVADKVLGLEKELRLFAYWNAKQSKKYVENKKAYNKVINTVNLYAYGEMEDIALDSARASAWASARASALDSALASAWDSARAFAWDSARAFAWDSARAFAWDSARAFAWDSARASAWASARAFAWDSARASAWASALDSALDSFMEKSEKAFIDIVCKGKLPAKVKTKNHF